MRERGFAFSQGCTSATLEVIGLRDWSPREGSLFSEAHLGHLSRQGFVPTKLPMGQMARRY